MDFFRDHLTFLGQVMPEDMEDAVAAISEVLEEMGVMDCSPSLAGEER